MISFVRSLFNSKNITKPVDYQDDITTKLPDELILGIFSRLNVSDLSQCREVNHRWRNLSLDKELNKVDLYPEKIFINIILKSSKGTKKPPEILKAILSKTKNLDLKKFSSKSIFVHLIRDDHFDYFPASLQNLNIMLSDHIKDSSLKKLPRGLKVLEMTFCENITDVGLQNLPRNLESLTMHYCRKLTNKGLANHLPSTLKHLHLTCCNQITKDCLDALPSTLKALRIGTIRIKQAHYEALMKKREGLKILENKKIRHFHPPQAS